LKSLKVELKEDPLSFLNQKIPLTEKISRLHRSLKERTGCIDRIAVVLYESKSDLLKTFLYSSEEDHPLIRYQAKLSDVPSLVEIRRSGCARVVHDLSVYAGGSALHTSALTSKGYGSSYTLPIFLNGRFVGFVFFNSFGRSAFEPSLLREMSLYGHFISSLVSAELALIRMMLSTLQAARKISAFHHVETGQHIDRVSHYARLIAQVLAPKFGFNDEFIENIFLFAPLHDIGKVGISDSLLNKNDHLSQEDFEKMKQHVVIGRRIVDSILDDFGFETDEHVRIVRNMTEYHHESIDGSGYALGLRGSEIPIEARIISVADIFDALTSSRSYKEAWSNNEAFAMLNHLAGIKLDMDCVRALTHNPDKVEEIQNGFSERVHPPRVGKRKFPRIPIELQGECLLLDSDKKEASFRFKTRNIGRDGLLFRSQRSIQTGAMLQLTLYHQKDKIVFTATTSWCQCVKNTSGSEYEIGVQFNPARQAYLLLIDFLLLTPLKSF